LAKATKFALEHGFRSHINARDRDGNTALYVLLRHVGRNVKTAIQSDYDAEVRDSIQLLLAHGANPNAPNRAGESALHAVFADGARRPLYVSRHGLVRRLKPTLQEISAVVDILLAHGADAAQRVAPLYDTPLHCAAHIFEHLPPDMFVVVKAAIQQLFFQLSRDSGAACVNAVNAHGTTVFVQLLTAVRRWFTAGAAGSNAVGRACTSFLTRMLQHFLKYGLDPNIILTTWAPRGVNGRIVATSSYYREIAAFISIQVPNIDAQVYDEARRLLVVLAQRGGNPNLVTFYSAASDDNGLWPHGGIENAPISLLIARALLGNHHSISLAGAVCIVDFFYKTLSQAKLRELGDGVQFFVASELPGLVSPVSRSILQRLTVTTPRSLRLLCRISIANHMKWRLAKRCSSLPLPRSMLQSLISFDM
jgi:Ankyrin repeat